MEKMTKEINEIKQEIIELKKEKKHILEENSTERMKTIMSKLQSLEKQNEKIGK
jgi:DNA-binding transcriptional regulator GbsR (MarR family)